MSGFKEKAKKVGFLLAAVLTALITFLSWSKMKTPLVKPLHSKSADSTSHAANGGSEPQEQAEEESELPEEFPLTPELVEELERSWDVLPKEVEVTMETTGWRIIRLEEGSILARAGFKVGHVISSEAVDDALADFSSPRNKLAQRIVRVMNRVTN